MLKKTKALGKLLLGDSVAQTWRSVAPVVLVYQGTEPPEPRNGRGRIAVRFIRASRFTWKPQGHAGMLLFLGRFSPQHSAGHL